MTPTSDEESAIAHAPSDVPASCPARRLQERPRGELSQREADLDSLLAKQATLKDQTSLATVTVHLQTPDAASAAEDDDKGFTAGLANGWDAFSGAATGGATVLGAVVPFAAALLLLGPPLWWAGMRISRTAPALRRKVSPIEPG